MTFSTEWFSNYFFILFYCVTVQAKNTTTAHDGGSQAVTHVDSNETMKKVLGGIDQKLLMASWVDALVARYVGEDA